MQRFILINFLLFSTAVQFSTVRVVCVIVLRKTLHCLHYVACVRMETAL